MYIIFILCNKCESKNESCHKEIKMIDYLSCKMLLNLHYQIKLSNFTYAWIQKYLKKELSLIFVIHTCKCLYLLLTMSD